MKHKTKKYLVAGVTAYVMIMFGMIMVMYLMGFTNPWIAYTTSGTIEAGGDSSSIADPQHPVGQGVLVMMMSSVNNVIKLVADNPEWGILGAVFGILGTIAMVKLGGQYILAYIVPIVLLALFANVFIFPTAQIATEPIFPFDVFLIGFFNLFLLLSVVEFVRSG